MRSGVFVSWRKETGVPHSYTSKLNERTNVLQNHLYKILREMEIWRNERLVLTAYEDKILQHENKPML